MNTSPPATCAPWNPVTVKYAPNIAAKKTHSDAANRITPRSDGGIASRRGRSRATGAAASFIAISGLLLGRHLGQRGLTGVEHRSLRADGRKLVEVPRW